MIPVALDQHLVTMNPHAVIEGDFDKEMRRDFLRWALDWTLKEVAERYGEDYDALLEKAQRTE